MAGPDQTWTPARIKTVIGRRSHKSMTLSAIARMLHRHGFSHQVPARPATERNEEAVNGWVKETWPQVDGARRLAVLRRRADFSVTPPTTRAWAPDAEAVGPITGTGRLTWTVVGSATSA
ncbi:winged helix-turn-helix domain-containing protein [Streptomyces massasporeus]|uniref:helix-turn-helix domain-containing protein n=1 Tax=Streptomyces massasporeus TaxID=67324 RepID=UPI0036906181